MPSDCPVAWNHDSLMADLADHLCSPARMVWCDLQLGPQGSARPDVYTLEKSFVRPCPESYEVKVSTADFRHDATRGKWENYLKFSSGVWFACPVGLLTRDVVPARAGLKVRGEKGWRTLRRPISAPVEIPVRVLLKLLIDGVGRTHRPYRVAQLSTHQTEKKLRRRYGDRVADILRDAGQAEYELKRSGERATRIVDDAQAAAERIRNGASDGLESLKGKLGLRDNATWASVLFEINRRTAASDRDSELKRLRRGLERVQQVTQHFLDWHAPNGGA